jgi:hypothetical protein
MSSEPDNDLIQENIHEAFPDRNGIDDKDFKALTMALSGIAESIVRKVIQESLPSILPPLIEQAIKNTLPESLPGVVKELLPHVAEEGLQTMMPGLLEQAVAGQQTLIREKVEEVTREALPGLMGPIVERLSKDAIQSEVRRIMDTTGQEIIEKVAWEIIPSQAEIEVKKEIERLTADA